MTLRVVRWRVEPPEWRGRRPQRLVIIFLEKLVNWDNVASRM
ncbi:MAG: hypothetical protein ACK5IP_03350 [Paracoccus sp. (in: a-proteobacteria)]